MDQINWNGGQRITLTKGATATCQALSAGQLYGIYLYNSSGADHDINATIIWSNSKPPVKVTVPGVTANQGLASLVLVSGDDTNTVSASITRSGSKQSDQLDVWIGSVGMPTDTSGLVNKHLAADGDPNNFGKYTRYYAVPESHWYEVTINSNINQFISAQYKENSATIYIVNPTQDANARVIPLGSVKENNQYTIVKAPASSPQTISHDIQGDGYQLVWMGADSEQDSKKATLTLQSLQ